jgi:hypothetical protein
MHGTLKTPRTPRTEGQRHTVEFESPGPAAANPPGSAYEAVVTEEGPHRTVGVELNARLDTGVILGGRAISVPFTAVLTGPQRTTTDNALPVLTCAVHYRTLEAENKSPRTIEAYTDAVRFLASYCQAHGHPRVARELEREHIQDFTADQLARWKPATAHNRYRGLHAFFKWAVAEGDLAASPMGWHATAPAARATSAGGWTGAPCPAAQDL